jgi:hypothetical protein
MLEYIKLFVIVQGICFVYMFTLFRGQPRQQVLLFVWTQPIAIVSLWTLWMAESAAEYVDDDDDEDDVDYDQEYRNRF